MLTTIERTDLVDAVLRSRDHLDPDLETDFLEAVVNAEADAAGDRDTAIRAINAAVTAALARGVGQHVMPVVETVDDKRADDEEDEN